MIRILLSTRLGERRWTQADLARATGIRPNTVGELYHELAERINLEHIDLSPSRKNGASALSQALRLRLDYLLLCWFPQSACSLHLVPFFQQTSQGREKFLLLIVHAATVQLMGIRVPADGQALYKSFPEIILVWRMLILTGVVCFIQLWSLPFTNRSPESLFRQPLYGLP